MGALISAAWFIISIFFIIAGKPFLEVCACFVIAGIFSGAHELYLMRKEMEDWTDDE